MSALLELVVELLVNGVGEVIINLIGFAEHGRDELHPVSRVVIFLLAGVLLGWFSRTLLPGLLIHSAVLQRWNFFVAPIFVGTVSWLMSSLRQRPVVARAVAASVFALSFAVARYYHYGA